jgi:Family of unknown function (DUF6174)
MERNHNSCYLLSFRKGRTMPFLYKQCSFLALLVGIGFWLFLTNSCTVFCQNNRHHWESKKQLWGSQKINSYKFTLSINCFCGGAGSSPVLIEVRDGAVKSITNVRTSESVEFPFFSSYETIPKLFSFIEHRLDKQFDSFCVKYDANLGYPKEITIDGKRTTADDELEIEISNLEILH